MKKFAALILAGAALLCFSCERRQAGAANAAGEAEVINSYEIAYSGMACGAPVAVAALKGYYAEEGVDITLVSGTAFEAQQIALAAGKMPIINGDFQFFAPIQNGFDIKLISGLHEGCIKVLVPADSPVRTVADLKDKTIIVDAIGGTPMMVASVAAKHAGLDPRIPGDIVWKPFPWDQLIQAMEKGEGDAVALWDPFATVAERSGNYRTLVDIAKDPVFAGRNCCFIFASGRLIKENPRDVAKVLRAVQRAVKWTGENPREAAELLIKNKKLATDDVQLVTGLLESYNYTAYYGAESIKKAKEDAVYFAKEMTGAGYLPNDLDAQSFVDSIFADVLGE